MDPFAPRESRRRAGARRSRTAVGEPAADRSKMWVLLAFVALLLVGYAFFVVLIGGDGAGTAEGGAPSGQRAVADPGGGREQRGAADQNRQDNGQSGGQDLPLTAPGDDDRGESNPNAGPDDHDVYVYEPEGSDQGPGPNGAEGEPGGYDPLGKDTDGPLLSETQLERAELAVSNYVTAVYGYSGDDFNEYQKQVGEAVVFPGFFSSPGAEHVREVQRQIEGSPDGVTNGAVLKGFTAERQTEERIEGVAYFDVGDGVAFSKTAASGVELQGEVTSYAQPVNLQLYGPQWRVTEAGQRQEVSD